MKKVLITGGGGFIGSHLAERLCPTCQVVILDNFRRNSLAHAPGLASHPNVSLVRADILDATQVREAMQGCDTVVHAAAIAGVSSYYSHPLDTLKVNIMGTMNILEAVSELGVGKYLGFSTSEAYGSDAFDVREDRGFAVGPVHDCRWTYAVSKITSENLAFRHGEKYGFKAYMVRPFNIYGPRQTGEGCIANFLRAVVESKPMIVHNDGSSIRAWCYVDDCVDALMTILTRDDLANDAFNIGNPQETYSTLGLARLVRQVGESSVDIVHQHMDRTDIRVRVPNIDKARKVLGFAPKVDLIEGLKRALAAYRKENA